MAKTCVTEQSARRQRWIENGLLEMMLTEKFEKISVTDLCAHLNLSRRSFYRYFSDLEDVLDSLLNHTFQDMVLPAHPMDIREFEKSYEFWISRRQLLDALSRSGLTDKLYEYTMRYTDPRTIGKYMVPDDLGMDILNETSLFVTSGFVSMIIAWHADGFRKTPEQMARIACRMLFVPILQGN